MKKEVKNKKKGKEIKQEIEILDMEEEIPKKKKEKEVKKEKIEEKKHKKHKRSILINIVLVLTIIILLASIYLLYHYSNENNKLEQDINEFHQNIQKVEDKISNSITEKDEKNNQYEKLKEEHKQELEELGIWEEMEKELKQSLS